MQLWVVQLKNNKVTKHASAINHMSIHYTFIIWVVFKTAILLFYNKLTIKSITLQPAFYWSALVSLFLVSFLIIF